MTYKRTRLSLLGDGATFVVASGEATARVKDNAHYVCDGIDDDVQIQAAIDALPVDGGVVQLLEGTFYISSTITIDREIYFLGAGKAAVTTNRGTVLYLVNNSNVDIMEITDAGSALYFQQVRGMKLNGNKANQASGRGIYAHGDVHDVVFQDLFVMDAKDQGIHVIADGGGVPHNFRVFGIWIEGCDGNGWEDNACDQIFMNFCYFYDNLRHLFSRGDYGIFNSNHFYKSHRENVYFSTGHYNIFEGNHVDGSGTVAASPGISLINSDNCIIVGNFSGNAKGTAQTYGILLDASTSNCLVQSNRFVGNVTGGVSDSGAGNMVRNNQGYVSENEGAAANISDGGTIAHGLAGTPPVAIASPSVASEIVSVTGLGAVNITVAIKKDDGTPGTQQTIYWRASL